MRAMVTVNIATNANLANGAWGEVVNIVLDPRDRPTKDDTRIVTLQ
jgi:hypothetical protein